MLSWIFISTIRTRFTFTNLRTHAQNTWITIDMRLLRLRPVSNVVRATAVPHSIEKITNKFEFSTGEEPGLKSSHINILEYI